jgi:hypothetical protein
VRAMAHRPGLAGLAVALVFGVCAPTALGAAPAKPIVIATGSAPSVAVDSAGTAHIAYNDNASANAPVHYCRLARGASACTAPQTFMLPGETTIRPYVFVEGATVRILAYRFGLSNGPFRQDFLLTSSDGGQTFGAPVSVGTLAPNDAVAGPGAAISLVSAAGPESPAYQRVPIDGSAPASDFARLSTRSPYETAVGLLGGSTPVAAFDDGASTPETSYSVPRDLANLNRTGSWSESVLEKGSAPHLAGGPVGLFLLLSTIDPSGAHQLKVSLFEDGRFSPGRGGAASYAQPGGFPDAALVQDDTGVLQVIYGAGDGQLMTNASSGAAGFGIPQPIAVDDSFGGLRAGAAADHAGVAVWTHGSGAGDEVHAARFAASIKAPPPVSMYDLRANGLEVTQSVQTREAGFLGGELPSLFPAPQPGQLPTRLFGNVKYRGVGLAAYSKTVVRLFADAAPVGSSEMPAVKDVIGVLHGFRAGRELPGSPLLAENGPRTLTDGGCSCATAAERADPTASYDFTLPLSWTVSGRDKLTLRGELRQQAGILTAFATARPVRGHATASAAAARGPRECTTCKANNRFTFTDIPFTPTPTVVIAPVRLFAQGDPPLPDPEAVFAPALNVHPGGERFLVEPYQANLDVTAETNWTKDSPECAKYVANGKDKFGDCKNDAYISRVRSWDRAQGGLSDMAIGVNTRERGVAGHSLFNLPFGHPDLTATPNEVSARPVAMVNTSRPLSSVGHELGHLLGRLHASPACDSGTNQDWPPDEVGYIGGIGLDRSQHTAGAGSPYRVIAGAPPRLGNCANATPPDCGGATPKEFFDLMSYCGNGANDWISTRNWDGELATLNRFGQRVGFDPRSFPSTPVPYVTATVAARAAAAPGQRLHVSGQVDDAGATIAEVGTAVHPAPAPASSEFTLVVYDAGGTTLSSTPMTAAASHIDGGEALIALDADVPASARAASVAIMQGGAAIATRARSAHPPTIRVIAPAKGTTIGTTGVVRWTANDADGDPLAATVAYSLDGGKRWRTIYSGPNTGSATLPGAYFSASRRARVLVRVNDGFDERGATSGRFRARGVRPVVRLRSPLQGTKLLSSSTLVLEGEAFDDASQPLTGKRLVWLAGKRRLGTGTALSTADLAPGRQRLRLVATDRTGRRGTAAVTVAVAAVAPQLLELSGPKRVSRRARKIVLRLAVTTRSKLTANGHTFTVGRHVSSVTLPIRPGRTPVNLRLVLRAGGKRTTVPLTIPRR